MLNPTEAVDARWVALSDVMREVQDTPNDFSVWFPGTLSIVLPRLDALA
jgi:isopentenyldiphosphate isomerase